MAEPDLARINNTLGKMGYHLANHNSVCVSVSGGSDSDIIVHMIAKYFRQYLYKTHFVFCNTGLEYKATREQLDHLRQKYGVNTWQEVSPDRYEGAMLRHYCEERLDPGGVDKESGLPHTWHILCNSAFLACMGDENERR